MEGAARARSVSFRRAKADVRSRCRRGARDESASDAMRSIGRDVAARARSRARREGRTRRGRDGEP